MLEEDQQTSFESAARPLIKWLCENVHEQYTIIVTPMGAELVERAFSTGLIFDYMRP